MLKAWWYAGTNWGDAFAPSLLKWLTGQRPVRTLGPGTLLTVGSIMRLLRANDVVWGTGMSSPDRVPVPLPSGVRFAAVRGPLTAGRLRELGADVPDIYGDPGLLAPHVFPERNAPRHALGVIPHYIDAKHINVPQGVEIINICAPLQEVTDAVCSCHSILSSSLHGLILADAYGRKASWLSVSGCKRITGGKFKFEDYLYSTGRKPVSTDIEDGGTVAPTDIKWLPPARIDAARLLSAFPLRGNTK